MLGHEQPSSMSNRKSPHSRQAYISRAVCAMPTNERSSAMKRSLQARAHQVRKPQQADLACAGLLGNATNEGCMLALRGAWDALPEEEGDCPRAPLSWRDAHYSEHSCALHRPQYAQLETMMHRKGG